MVMFMLNLVDISCKPQCMLYAHQMGLVSTPMPLFDPSGYASTYSNQFNTAELKRIFFRGLGMKGDRRDSKSSYHRTYNRAQSAIGHLYLNLNYLLETIEKQYEENDSSSVNLGTFLGQMIEDMNTACGPNHKFALMTNNMFPNVTNIIDINQDLDLPSSKIFNFNVQSNASAVRKFGFITTVPSALSATIAIAASNPRSVEGLDQVTFAAINRGIKNRLMQTASTIKTIKNKEEDLRKYANQIRAASSCRDILESYRSKLMDSIGNTSIDEEFMGVTLSQVRTSLAKMQTLTDVLCTLDDHGQSRRNPPSSTPIPIKLSLELDGISGLVIGQIFKVDKTRLPSSYRHQDICFQINSEEQKITTGGDWITKFQGMMQIIPSKSGNSNAQGYIQQIGKDLTHPNQPHFTQAEAKEIWDGASYSHESEESVKKALDDVTTLQKNFDVIEARGEGGLTTLDYQTMAQWRHYYGKGWHTGTPPEEELIRHPDYPDGPVVVAIYGRFHIQFDGWEYYIVSPGQGGGWAQETSQTAIYANAQARVYREGGYGQWPGQAKHTEDGGNLVGGLTVAEAKESWGDGMEMDGYIEFSTLIYTEQQAINLLKANMDEMATSDANGKIPGAGDIYLAGRGCYTKNYSGSPDIPDEYHVLEGEPYKLYIVPANRRR